MTAAAAQASRRLERWRFPLLAWLLSRFFFLEVGALTARFVTPASPATSQIGPAGRLSYWAHWDGAWYTAIASHGYHQTRWPASAAFFPAYPELLRAVTWLVGAPAIAGVAVSFGCGLLATVFVYELGRHYIGDRAAGAGTLAFVFFPTAFFLNAVYSEALFLLFATASLWAAAIRRNFVLAAILGACAAASRSVGVLLIIPLLGEWHRQRPSANLRALASVAIVPVGLLAYTTWLWRTSHHPLLFATVLRTHWGRQLTNPWSTIQRAWQAAQNGAGWAAHPEHVFATASSHSAITATDTYNLAFLLLLLMMLAVSAATLPPDLTLYSACASLIPLLTPATFSPLASLPRYLLAAFPLFLSLGATISRRRSSLWAWLVLSAAFGGLLTAYFATWRWVA